MRLRITRPDDWHLHLRDGKGMADVVAHSARSFARAVIMPNLQPPVTTVHQANVYRERILAALPRGAEFEPLMTLYLTDLTTEDEIVRAAGDGSVFAAKLYPAGATTNSEAGVTDLNSILPLLETMREHEMPLLVHGEVTDPDVDIFDREKVFIDRVLAPLVERLPGLRVVLEHITTREAVAWVLGAPPTVGAIHREALLWAATSGNPRFFLGTDSAPHTRQAKESRRGCAGIFSAHGAIELCAEVFETVGSLDLLEAFTSHYGADFYGLARNESSVTLVKEEWEVPESYRFGDDEVIPLKAGETIGWRVD
jgi:dihydroorotase